MKKMTLVGMISGALAAAVIGSAGPAQADENGSVFGGQDNGPGYGYNFGSDRDDSNNPWLGQLFPSVKVPQVDTSVRN